MVVTELCLRLLYYPIISVPSDSDVEMLVSLQITDYIPASPDYSPASSGNTSSDPSEDLSKDLLASLAISPFHDDPYMKDFYSGNDHRGYPGSPLIRYEESSGQDP
ncbi:hypothetical protein Tco_1144151 [Tanacetum coccineum]